MNRFSYIILLLFAGMLCMPVNAGNKIIEVKSRYASIYYFDQNYLREFNKKLYMGKFSSTIRATGGDTIETEVAAKIDFVVEKAMKVLDMFPKNLKFSIVIRPTPTVVQNDFKRLYKVNVDYIAFYSPQKNRVFFSANQAKLKVVAHEIGHVVVENYFKVSPPQRIHEVMAQFAEAHITD